MSVWELMVASVSIARRRHSILVPSQLCLCHVWRSGGAIVPASSPPISHSRQLLNNTLLLAAITERELSVCLKTDSPSSVQLYPPASSRIKLPAAKSHSFWPPCKYTCPRPAAIHAHSSADEPKLRCDAYGGVSASLRASGVARRLRSTKATVRSSEERGACIG